MSTPRTPFEFDCYYHVYNHARGNDNLFEEDSDYKMFLELITRYIASISKIYAYCLMPNHFHFLIKFDEVEIPNSFHRKELSYYYSHQWGNVQNTYSKKKNYRTGNRGGLFCQSINRNLVDSEEYLQHCIVYLHNNPVHHGFSIRPEDWKYSSYNKIMSVEPTLLERTEVIGWFENKHNFINYHNLIASDIFAEKYKLP